MTKFEKKRLLWARLTGCAVLGLLAAALLLGAFILRSASLLRRYEERVDTVISRMEDISAQLSMLDVGELVLTLNGVSAELGDVDVHGMAEALDSLSVQLESINWEELANNVNDMALDTQEKLEAAGETLRLAEDALRDLDIETLNRAITDLQTVITPLAEIMTRFQ